MWLVDLGLFAMSSHGLSLVCVCKLRERERGEGRGHALIILSFLIRTLNLLNQGPP